MVLGDLLDVDEPFIIQNQLGAAHRGGKNNRAHLYFLLAAQLQTDWG